MMKEELLITNIRVETLQGKRVNVLVHGEDYIYAYDVIFHRALKKAQFWVFDKTKNGVPTSGCAFPSRTAYLEETISGGI